MSPETITALVQQAPGFVGALALVIVFLKHIRESEAANRDLMRELRDAIKELAGEMKKEHRS